MTVQERARIESRRQPAKRRKKRDDIAGTELLTRQPVLTREYAAQFVKLLHAGIPPLTALSYFSPVHFDTLDRQGRLKWLSQWERDPLMAAASTAYMKGMWEDLDKDDRLAIALDKHMAELAYLLYSSDYAKSEGAETKKLDAARDAITAWISQGSEDADSPIMRAMKELLEGKVEGMLGGPPRLGDVGVSVPVPIKKES